MIDTLTILGLSLGITSGSVYVRTRLGPFRQLQRGATFARACVICAGRVARTIPDRWRMQWDGSMWEAGRDWRYCWPDAVREAKEGR